MKFALVAVGGFDGRKYQVALTADAMACRALMTFETCMCRELLLAEITAVVVDRPIVSLKRTLVCKETGAVGAEAMASGSLMFVQTLLYTKAFATGSTDIGVNCTIVTVERFFVDEGSVAS